MKRSLLIFSVFVMTLLVVGGTLTAQAAGNQNDAIVEGPLVKPQGTMAKVGLDLANLHREYQAHVDRVGNDKGFKSSNPLVRVVGNRVVIDAAGGSTLADDLKGLGLQGSSSFGRQVSGQLPIGAIQKAAALGSLKSARPAYVSTRGGLVTSQGDPAMRSDVARATFGVDGSGVTVGSLSDS
ncbi:MAG: peptidase S8, partial [Chloroflexi bacterium]|nr:peptidase S8 [Chloroflexota bacterium]